jgi:glyoxylase-like metal-dependent hydrolase (beta-lactamase superfamily II)
MLIKRFVAGQLENNMYLVADEASKKAVLIDASSNIPELIEATKDYDVEYILLTHGHFDHIMGLSSLKEALKAPAVICKADLVVSDNINEFTRLFGLPDSTPPTYEKFVKNGEIIKVGNMEIKVITTPGHTEGGVCYLVDGNLFSGDTLFKGSVGRTDLFGGNFNKLVDSIKNKLFKLDDNVKVFPGHGEMTTIAYEKKHNEII